jgi:acyl-CoA synthetase (AMP-forming)/AMP-acid ligase II
VAGSLVRIIRITEAPLPQWSDELLVSPGEVGEITVRSPVVTREYYARPEQTRAAKIAEGEAIVHRMGDVGYLDAQGRLWMCGRKSHRVETQGQTLFTAPVEEVLNQHPAVKRTALVGPGPRGAQRPLILVEREAGSTLDDAGLYAQLRDLAARHTATRGLTEFLVYPGAFPVDARHNAKIEREKLTRWAEARGR